MILHRIARRVRAWLPVVIVATAGCAAPGAVGQMDVAPSDAASPQAAVREAGSTHGTRAMPPLPSQEWVCPTNPLTPRYEATLYVDTDGSDQQDGRTPERAVRTLQRAADLVGPGDVVWVRDGVYSSDVEFTTSGRESEPIVVESHPGECAILDGSEVSAGRRVTLDGVSHMVFRNFVVRNSPAEGVYLIESDDNVLTNLRIHGNYYSGITSLASDRNLFAFVISHDNADAGGGDADGISVSSGDANHIAHCVTFDNSDDGVDTWRSTNTLVERCASFRNGRGGGDGNGFKAGGDDMVVNTVIRYSIAFENQSNGFDFNTGGRVTFDHNTAFGNARYGFVVTDAVVRNNLSVDNGSGSWYGELIDGDAVANSWDLNVGLGAFVSIDGASRDYLRLTGSSNALDAGSDIGAPFAGAAPDLGALESGETIGSTIGIDLSELIAP